MGARVLRMAGRGFSDVQIAGELQLNRKTVATLRKEYAAEAFDLEDRERLREDVLQSINEVKLRAWAELDRRKDPTPAQKARKEPGDRVIAPTNKNLPDLLDVIGRQDDRLIKLLGLGAPEEVNVNHRTPAERVKAFEEWRRSKGRPPLVALQGGLASDGSLGRAAHGASEGRAS